jgi:hypothetical protein
VTDWELYPQLQLAAGYTDLEQYVPEGQGVKVVRGTTEEGALRPSKISFRALDDTDQWRPSNPSGPHYGVLQQYMNGAFSTGGTVRSAGEVASFKADETSDHRAVAGVSVAGVRWVDIEIQGQLRRIGQWDDPLQSALRNWISGYTTLRGYWPLEDDRDAERLANVYANGQPGYHSGVTLGGTAGPGGSDSVVKLNTGGLLGGSFDLMPVDNTGWQIAFATDAAAPSGTDSSIFTWWTSDGLLWQWQQSSGQYRLLVTDREGTVKLSATSSFGTAAAGPGFWRAFRLKCTRTGTTVKAEWAWYGQDTGVFGQTSTFTGPATRPTAWRIGQTANNVDAGYGHVFANYGTAEDLVDDDFFDAFDGYLGEGAGDRYQRIMGQFGLGWQRIGFLADFQRMGRQPIATLSELLEERRTTEDGLIFDRAADIQVTFRGRQNMQNQTPKLALTWPDDLSGMKEISDDLKCFNDVTVKNRGGGEANAVLATGPGSVAAIGRVRKTVNVNVDERVTDLRQLAGYWLNRFTVVSPRFSDIVVDLDASPALATAAASVDIGDIITVDGRTPDQLVMRVTGIEETARQTRRLLTFTVEPADIWSVGVYDAATTRADARGHKITGGPFAAGVSPILVDYTTGTDADGLKWTVVDGSYDIVVAGERMTVTAVADSGAHQLLTVTRGVNGVTKTLTAGDSVQLADPARYGR